MNFCLRLTRLGAALVFGWLLSGALSAVAAQPVGDPSLAKSTAPEDLSQTELLRSYLQLREQLHATQLAVLNSRVESDAVARAQAAALTEKLDAIKVSIET